MTLSAFLIIIFLLVLFLDAQRAGLEYIQLNQDPDASSDEVASGMTRMVKAGLAFGLLLALYVGYPPEHALRGWKGVLEGILQAALTVVNVCALVYELIGFYSDLRFSKAQVWFHLRTQVIMLIIISLAVLL